MKKSGPAQGGRNVLVFASLIGGLTLTSVLLLAIAPPPLKADATRTLFAIDTPESLAVVFDTQPAVQKQRWTRIYVHHSRTAGGNADTLGQDTGGLRDHFIIGNGDGCEDGAIQIGPRWQQQVPALPPIDANYIDPGYISVCLVGDFDHSAPTATQVRRLGHLVSALQAELGLNQNQVLMLDHPSRASGIGRYFPLAAFREQQLLLN